MSSLVGEMDLPVTSVGTEGSFMSQAMQISIACIWDGILFYKFIPPLVDTFFVLSGVYALAHTIVSAILTMVGIDYNVKSLLGFFEILFSVS